MRFEYDEESKGKHPFWIDKLTPIQIATFDLDEYRDARREFTTDEWLDLIVRSMGYEPAEMNRRLKLLFLLRLVPLAERNYNLVELGPRGTGKSYVDPGALALRGARSPAATTVANLFGHMNGRQKGMVQIWDVVGFDEVADLQKMPKEVITTLKTYCESGTLPARPGGGPGEASDRAVRQHQPAGRRDGPDRPPVRADARRHPRRHGLHRPACTSTSRAGRSRRCGTSCSPTTTASWSTTWPRPCASCGSTTSPRSSTSDFALGAHLNARDRKAVRKTVSGLIKILHPHGEVIAG